MEFVPLIRIFSNLFRINSVIGSVVDPEIRNILRLTLFSDKRLLPERGQGICLSIHRSARQQNEDELLPGSVRG